MTTDNHEELKEADMKGILVVGGTVKEVITTSESSAVQAYLSSLLQVKNFVVLLGSGASFHSGSPQTRNLTNQQVLDLMKAAGSEPSDPDEPLLTTINPNDNGDLKQLLNGLQLAASLAYQTRQDTVTLGSGAATTSYQMAQVEGLRQRFNRALAEA